MPHDLAFADAARPARAVILGLPLLDYSIGHELILTQQRNELVCGGFEKLTPEQQQFKTRMAVLVCNRDWKQKPHRWLRLWSWTIRRSDYALAVADFRNYRAAGSNYPPIATNAEPGGRPLGAPFLAQLLQFVIQKLGQSESRAFDYPMGLACFHYFTEAECEGRIRIVNQSEMDFEEYCRIEDEKAPKEVACPA